MNKPRYILVLSNSLKIVSFQQLGELLDECGKSNGGEAPEKIMVNYSQKREYKSLLPQEDGVVVPKSYSSELLYFRGIPIETLSQVVGIECKNLDGTKL